MGMCWIVQLFGKLTQRPTLWPSRTVLAYAEDIPGPEIDKLRNFTISRRLFAEISRLNNVVNSVCNIYAKIGSTLNLCHMSLLH